MLSSCAAGDARAMLKLLKLVSYDPDTQGVCCQLAHLTSREAFDIVCAKHERRGLVFVFARDSGHQLGQVLYDKESNWLHSLVAGLLSSLVTLELARKAGAVFVCSAAECDCMHMHTYADIV